MVNLLAQDKRIYKDLSPKGKRDYLLLYILTGICFVVCAYGIMDAMYYVCNILGSFVCKAPYQALEQIKTTAPLLVGIFGLVYVLTVLSRLLFVRKEVNKNKLMFKSGIAYLAIGLFVLIYFIIGASTGLYRNTIANPVYHNKIFIELILMSILYLLFGGLHLFISFKLKDFASEIPSRDTHYGVAIKIFRGIFAVILIISAAYSFYCLIFGSFTIDLSHNIDYMHDQTFYVVTFVLTLVACLSMAVVYLFMYLPLKEENKLKFRLIASNVFLGTNLVIFIMYCSAHAAFPNAPIVACYGLMPIEYSACANVFGYIFGFINVGTPLVALILSIIKYKKANK